MKKVKIVSLGVLMTFLACNAPDPSNRGDQLILEKKALMKNVASTSNKSSDARPLGAEIQEQVLPVNSTTDIGNIFNSEDIISAINTERFSINANREYSQLIEVNTGRYIYTMHLETTDPDVNAGLIIAPIDISHGIYEVFITKAVNNNGVNHFSIKSVASDLPFIDLDPSVESTPAGLSTEQKEIVAKFKGCMAAAWEELTRDLIPSIGCSSPMFFTTCVSACLLKCGYDAIAHAGYSTPECVGISTQDDAIKCLCSVGAINCLSYRLTSIPAKSATIPVNVAFVSPY